MDESGLIIKLKAGSHKAFEEIYNIYSKRLLGFCFQYTKSYEDSEEIVQDVFVKLWNNRNDIRQKNTLKPLLFVIAKNRLINIYRSRINSPIYEEYINYHNARELSVNDAHQSIEYDDFRRELNKALKKLPQTQQAVFNCCKIQQMSNKEAAELLSISEQTVKNQLSLCLKALRNSLKYSPFWAVIFLNM